MMMIDENCLSVSSDRHTDVLALKEALKKELLAELQGGSISRQGKLKVIKGLVLKNEKVTVTDVLIALKIKGANYARELMQEAAKENDYVYVRGGAWRESYLTSAKFEGQNKILWAFSEIYKGLLAQPIGTTKRIDSIAKEFNLSREELQRVVGLLAQQKELFILTSSHGLTERRIKRVA